MRMLPRPMQLTLLSGALRDRANQRRWQDDGREVLTCDGSGLSFSACAARLLPAGSWQRTLSASVALSLTGSTGCAVSLRVRATKSGRSLLVPTMLGRHIEGSESGSSEDEWETPTSHERTHSPRDVDHGRQLANQVVTLAEYPEHWKPKPGESSADYWERVNREDVEKGYKPTTGDAWPTPRAEDSESAGAHVARGTAETLTAAARLWPTATSGDGKSSGTRTGTPNAKSTASHGGTTLTDAANGLWASPQARDWKDSGPTQGNRKSPNLGTQTWATPQSFDANDCHRSAEALARAKTKGGCANLREQVQPGLLDQGSHSTSGKRRGLASRGSLCFLWVAQLLGFPNGWLEVPPSEYPML